MYLCTNYFFVKECSNIAYNEKKVEDQNCDMPCSDYTSLFCGGTNYTNSYSLSTITTSSEITVKGCEYTVPPISCGPNQQILNSGMIKYGRWDNSVCPPVNPDNPFNYTVYSLPNRCIGQSSCVLGKRNGLTDLKDPYAGTIKHFEITYSCGLFPLVTADNLMTVENSGCNVNRIYLMCPVNYYVVDGFFMYGRWDNKICPTPEINENTPISYQVFNLPLNCLLGVKDCPIGYGRNISKQFGDPSLGFSKHVGSYDNQFEMILSYCLIVALEVNLQQEKTVKTKL